MLACQGAAASLWPASSICIHRLDDGPQGTLGYPVTPFSPPPLPAHPRLVLASATATGSVSLICLSSADSKSSPSEAAVTSQAAWETVCRRRRRRSVLALIPPTVPSERQEPLTAGGDTSHGPAKHAAAPPARSSLTTRQPRCSGRTHTFRRPRVRSTCSLKGSDVGGNEKPHKRLGLC